MPETRLPIDARIIAINETEYYNLPEEHKPYIQAIHGVYLYDANQQVHCCDLAASYYLIFLYNLVILTKEGERLDKVWDEYNCPGENTYMYCRTVKKLAKATADYMVYGGTGISYDESDYDEQIADLVETFSCNLPF